MQLDENVSSKDESQSAGQATYSVFAGMYHGGWCGFLEGTTTGRVDRLKKYSERGNNKSTKEIPSIVGTSRGD